MNTPTSTDHSWQPWIVSLSAATFFLYEFIQMSMLSSINQDLMQYYNIDATQLGLLATSYYVANILFLIPAAQLLDRYSPRKLILINMVCCVLGTVLFALSTHFILALFCRFFTGIGSAFCFLSVMRILTRWFLPKKVALATGLVVTIGMLGGLIAQTPFAYLAQTFGWKNALFLNALLGSFLITLIFATVKDHPDEQKDQSVHHTIALPLLQSFKRAYMNKQNWLCGMYTCLMNLPIFILGALWGSLYLQQVHHLTRTQSTDIMSMIYIGTMLGSPTVGWISDRMGHRKPLMLLGTVLSFIIILAIIFVPHWTFSEYTLLFLLLGFITSTQVISYPVVNESNPLSITATATSAISFCCIGSGIIFPPLFGALMDFFWDKTTLNGIAIYSENNFITAMSVIPLAFILAFFCAWKIKETYCQREHSKILFTKP